ncbi:MAG: M20/M25/M40 family metallo-hydrolase [Anaerolineales bacterium]|nr:M20/M25/M40 family metallo-hydrolase [Anaerolineales bacterium]
MMKKLLQTLTEAYGPSGYEGAVRDVIRKIIKPYADEIRVDALGNLIARKGKLGKGGQKIMLAAHMDEIGLMVSHVDSNGFARFTSLGLSFGRYMLGGRVRFMNGVQGVIGYDRLEKVHEMPPLNKMYIDVGATGRKDCPVKVGDVAAFERPFLDMGKRVVAKSLDDRVGVAALIEAMRRLKSSPNEMVFAFTTQEEFTSHGALVAAYGIDPDLGIAVDVTPTGDTPHVKDSDVALGKGAAIKVKDQSMLSDPRIVAWMKKTALKAKIQHQTEVLLTGTTDAYKMQTARAGVPVGCISIPIRYVHSPSEMVDLDDIENCIRLLVALLRSPVTL